jgi:pseudouridine-5'-phosphate glycosidase
MTYFVINKSIQLALRSNSPIVALETAVLTHGLPHPVNIQLSLDAEAVILSHGATPATIGLINGDVIIGLTNDQISYLGDPGTKTRKISKRDYGIAISQKLNGGTTVCGTMIAAQKAGIQVFATGGIGGVHRNTAFDVSADLPQLASTPMIVVCAGAKSILDLPNTLEYLETHGVPVIGYGTDEFPAFFSRTSGLKADIGVQTAKQIAEIALSHWEFGNQSAVLVVVPPPAESALDSDVVEAVIQQALAEAEKEGITGAATTPFLLSRVKELTGGSSLQANLDLLKNNAAVGAEIAVEITKLRQKSI